jgi:hypothetical protein
MELGKLRPRTPEFTSWVGLLFFTPAMAKAFSASSAVTSLTCSAAAAFWSGASCCMRSPLCRRIPPLPMLLFPLHRLACAQSGSWPWSRLPSGPIPASSTGYTSAFCRSAVM